MQERINATPFAKDHLLCLLRSRTPALQVRLATSLAHLLEPDDIARAYGPYGGAAVLLEQACDPAVAASDPPAWERALEALQRVVRSCKERQDKNSTSFVPAPPEEKVRAARTTHGGFSRARRPGMYVCMHDLIAIFPQGLGHRSLPPQGFGHPHAYMDPEFETEAPELFAAW